MRNTKVKALRRAMKVPAGTPMKRYFRLNNGAIINDGWQGKFRQVKKAYNKLNCKQRGLV